MKESGVFQFTSPPLKTLTFCVCYVCVWGGGGWDSSMLLEVCPSFLAKPMIIHETPYSSETPVYKWVILHRWTSLHPSWFAAQWRTIKYQVVIQSSCTNKTILVYLWWKQTLHASGVSSLPPCQAWRPVFKLAIICCNIQFRYFNWVFPPFTIRMDSKWQFSPKLQSFLEGRKNSHKATVCESSWFGRNVNGFKMRFDYVCLGRMAGYKFSKTNK